MSIKLLIAKAVCAFGSSFQSATEKTFPAHSQEPTPVTQKSSSRQFFTQEAKLQQKSFIGETFFTKDGGDRTLTKDESRYLSNTAIDGFFDDKTIGRYKPHPIKTPWIQTELIKARPAPILDSGKPIVAAFDDLQSVNHFSISPQWRKEPTEEEITSINNAVRQQLADLGINKTEIS